MDKKITKEDIIKAARSCTDSDCKSCPFRHESCAKIFAAYIASDVKSSKEQETLSDFDYYISQMFTDDQRMAYDVGKSYQALKQLAKLAGGQSD